jgi:hypothetical protein
MNNRRSSSKTSPTPITPDTAVVLCAIAALLAVLVFLESRIRRLSIHVALRSPPRFGAVPRRAFDHFVNRETQQFKQ